jgi:transcriptional regulator with GAF, ATPase, and Fis domain
VVFLDEVGELSLVTQAMLLRMLSEGEIVPVGESRCRKVDVRVVVATNRNLKAMVEQGTFRADLYYRLRCLQLVLPPLRERGGDWQLILEHNVNRLAAIHRMRKCFTDEALSVLSRYQWPGNVREVRGLVDTAYHLSESNVIGLQDFGDALEEVGRVRPRQPTSTAIHAAALYAKLLERRGTFWSLVHEPYLDRDLKRTEVRALIKQGLAETRGSYKKLLELLGVAADDYLKFMDFLRHHNLKPDEVPPVVPPVGAIHRLDEAK